MAVIIVTGRVIDKPEQKTNRKGDFLILTVKEKNKHHSRQRNIPMYNFYNCLVSNEELMRRVRYLEKNDIVTITCDVMPIRRHGIIHNNYKLLSIELVFQNAPKESYYSGDNENYLDNDADMMIEAENELTHKSNHASNQENTNETNNQEIPF